MKNNNESAVSGQDFVEASFEVFFFYKSTEASCAALIKWATSLPPVGSEPHLLRELHVIGGGGLVYPAIIAMNFVYKNDRIHVILTEPCSSGTMIFGFFYGKGQRRYTVLGSLTIHGFDTYCHRHPNVVHKLILEDCAVLIRLGVHGSFLYAWAQALTGLLAYYRDAGCIDVRMGLDTYLSLSVDDISRHDDDTTLDDISVMMDRVYSRRFTL